MANESKVFRYDMAEPHPILSKDRDYNKNPRKFYCKLSGILNHSLVKKQANYTYSLSAYQSFFAFLLQSLQ